MFNSVANFKSQCPITAYNKNSNSSKIGFKSVSEFKIPPKIADYICTKFTTDTVIEGNEEYGIMGVMSKKGMSYIQNFFSNTALGKLVTEGKCSIVPKYNGKALSYIFTTGEDVGKKLKPQDIKEAYFLNEYDENKINDEIDRSAKLESGSIASTKANLNEVAGKPVQNLIRTMAKEMKNIAEEELEAGVN
jgi:hypothetical protein